MGIIDTLLSPNGRLSRLGFWGWSLALGAVIPSLTYVATLGQTFGAHSFDTLTWPHSVSAIDVPALPLGVLLLIALPMTWISFCLLAKRWHDRGKSGWWVLLGLVPVIGPLWTLIECGFMAGTKGTNRYGPSPDGYRSRLVSYRLEDMPEDMP